MAESSQQCRVRVWLDRDLQLCYRAERTAANRFAAAVRTTGTTVTVDALTDSFPAQSLRPLPCERLWQ